MTATPWGHRGWRSGWRRSMGAHSTGLLRGHRSSSVTDPSCCRWGTRAIPVPCGLVTCPWGVFGLETTSGRRGSAPLRTAELESNIIKKRYWSSCRSGRSVVSRGAVTTNCCDCYSWHYVCDPEVSVSLKLLRLRTVIFKPSASSLPVPATNRHPELSRRTKVGCFFSLLFFFSFSGGARG